MKNEEQNVAVNAVVSGENPSLDEEARMRKIKKILAENEEPDVVPAKSAGNRKPKKEFFDFAGEQAMRNFEEMQEREARRRKLTENQNDEDNNDDDLDDEVSDSGVSSGKRLVVHLAVSTETMFKLNSLKMDYFRKYSRRLSYLEIFLAGMNVVRKKIDRK